MSGGSKDPVAGPGPDGVPGTSAPEDPATAGGDERPRPEGAAGEAAPDGAASAAAEATGGGSPYRVQLPTFEGPLDLLLHLIQQHELDIMDIPIAFVTERYLAFVTLMQELNIDLASEYLVMAATLTHIKSKMLLPSVPEDQEDGELEPEEDPRLELVRRLLEYQKYKEVAAELGDRSLLGRDVFERGVAIPTTEGQAPLAPVNLFKLLEAFQAVIDRAEIRTDHEVQLERFSITERISELSDVLSKRPRLRFEELFEGARTRGALIITFLALLEMTRLRMTRLMQAGPMEPILIELAVTEGEAAGVQSGSPPAEEPTAREPTARTTADEVAPADASAAEQSDEPAAEPAGRAAETEPK
jgi:segregation and condensation protein A